MATRLTGWEAITFAERSGATLSVHAGDGEPARDSVTIDEAREVAASRPDRVYVDFDEPEPEPGGERVG